MKRIVVITGANSGIGKEAALRYAQNDFKHFNDRLEVMKVAPENPALKDILGTSVYPAYADRQDVQEKVFLLCQEFTAGII